MSATAPYPPGPMAPLQIRDLTLPMPVILAPMAGITDAPFRAMVAQFGAGLLVSEMVASGEMITARPSMRAQIRAKARLGETGLPVSVQLAGREPAPMAEAARILTDQGTQIIDINMGCPAKKVTGGLSGAALMRDPDQALRLIEAVVGATDRPVTLKMRLGWDDSQRNASDLARRARDAGVAMIALHGRTRAQFYTGQADWAAIGAVRADLPKDCPLVANGDVTSADSARAALRQSGAQAVMVGRGAQGRPWLLAQIAANLAGRPAPAPPRGAALADLVAAHYAAILGFYGRDLGARVARKHLGWYADAAGLEPGARKALFTAPDPDRASALIRALFTDAPETPPRKEAAA